MAQVNKTIYPDVSSGTYYTATKTISGSNFPGQLGVGLEKSITYTMSTNPRAPYNSLFYTHLTSGSDNQLVEIYSQVQRIALLQGWPQAFGSDRCGSISYIQHPWDANFTSSSPLYSAYKWNAIVGRLCCTWYVDPSGRELTTTDNYYNGTWKDFKDLIQQGGHEYVLISVWLEVYGGGLGTDINDRRQAGIKGMNLYKVPIYAWDADNSYDMVHDEGFLYAPMRPMANFGLKQYNNFTSAGSNQADCCWPVYNYGYGISGASPDTFSFYDVRGRIIYGVDEDLVNNQYTFTANFGQSNGHKTFGISTTAYGVNNLINLIERKAACLGIITYTDCHDTGECPAIRTDTVANVFNRPDIICPIMTEDGYYNGDFITTAEQAPGTSAEALIGGDKDVPFDDGGGTVDPGPEPPTDTEYYLGKDGFTMEFGAKTIPTSTHHEPEFNDINNYYLTHEYRPVIRFTSPVDHEEYTVNTNILTDYQKVEPWYDIRANTMPVTWICDGSVKIMPKNTATSYLQGARYPYGMALTAQEITDMAYPNMYPEASENAVTLGQLVDYFRRLDPDFTSDDVYTKIFFDFYDKNGTTLYGTKFLDFSSLYGSGIDATTTDGKGEEGHSWDQYPGPGDYDDSEYQGDDKDETKLEKPNIQPYNKFQKTYIMGAEQVEALADKLTTTDDKVFEAILAGLEIFGAKPMDALIDLRLYPFDVAQFTGTSTAVQKDIILGRYDTNIAAIPMRGNPECTIDIGGYKIKEKFHSFLDYEPYTTMRLYIPYIGTIDLPPSIYMGHIVSVKLIVDFFTGACRAVIFNDGYAMTYQDGIIGTSIAMTGDDATQYANGIIGNLVGAIGSAAGAVVQGSVGRMDKAVTSAAGAAGDLFDMGQSINDINFQQAGTAAPNIGQWMPQQCHILIARPQVVFNEGQEMGIYGSNVGFATAYTRTISDLTPGGIYYGVLPEHIGIGTAQGEPTPTAKEIDMIKQALNNGFYVGIGSQE